MEISQDNFKKQFSSTIVWEVSIQTEHKKYLKSFKTDLYLLQKELVKKAEGKNEEEVRNIDNSILNFYSGLYIRATLLKINDEELSKVLISQKQIIKSVLKDFLVDYEFYLHESDKKKFIEINPELFSFLSDGLLSPQQPLKWNKSGTALIELIISLLATNSIQSQSGNLTQVEAMSYFERSFNISLGEYSKKLNSATRRKKNKSPFLDSLKEGFMDYCEKPKNQSL